MNKLLALLFSGLMLLAGPINAKAAVIMTDGKVVAYDPNETYIFSGVLGPAPAGRTDSFNAGWTFTDPNHAMIVTIETPADWTASIVWDIRAVSGLVSMPGAWGVIPPGGRTDIRIGNFEQATATRQHTAWLGLAAPGLSPSVTFGPGLPNNIFPNMGSGLPSQGDTGLPGGGNGGVASPIPEPSTVWLLTAGLALLGLGAAKRKKTALPALG